MVHTYSVYIYIYIFCPICVRWYTSTLHVGPCSHSHSREERLDVLLKRHVTVVYYVYDTLFRSSTLHSSCLKKIIGV